jgi:excisionase family DNA binding protein
MKGHQMNEKFMTPAEAASYLSITVKGLRKLISERRVKFYRLSDSERGRIRFQRADLDTYMASLAVDVRQEMTPSLQARLIQDLI